MEDVLEVYRRPYDPKRPQVCIDETSKQLLAHARTPIPAAPGTPARVDDEYKRSGTANIFLCVEPLTGVTIVKATERRTKIDFAHFIKELCDGPYRDAKERSRELRSSMTDAEIALWSKIRRKQLQGLQFHRQKPIGNYIVDFYCPAVWLVIEIDGGQHYTPEGTLSDANRDEYLQSLGLSVLRFSNLDVLRNIDGVMATIIQKIETKLNEKETISP